MKIAGRQVEMFRTQYDPMIGPKPRNAFMLDDLKADGFINDTETAVVVRLPNGIEHVVPFTNVQSLRLKREAEVIPMKKKSGAV